MIDQREDAFKNISRILAITRYDIEQRQSVNDLGLNIHGENYFRDVLNFVFEGIYKFKNENFNSQNSSCIDLIDENKKIALQVTTTRTKRKMSNTFKALKIDKYKGYDIKILYLLDKVKPNKDTVLEYKKEYGVDLSKCLLDYKYLIMNINNLEHSRIIKLNNEYFKNNSEKYTDEIVLNLVFRHLIQNSKKVTINYDDEFGNIDTQKKIVINNINERITNKINGGLDFVNIMYERDEDNLLSNLRILIIDTMYKNILLESLSKKISRSELMNKNLEELQSLSKSNNLNFNKIIHDLQSRIENKIDVLDYNSMSISWIIVAFFFEICDIGMRE